MEDLRITFEITDVAAVLLALLWRGTHIRQLPGSLCRHTKGGTAGSCHMRAKLFGRARASIESYTSLRNKRLGQSFAGRAIAFKDQNSNQG